MEQKVKLLLAEDDENLRTFAKGVSGCQRI
jgi:hypothetical protein